TKLSKQQKDLLRQFQDTETGDETPNSTGFFGKLKDAWEDLTE
ncbi:MAG: molecular chaperone DnaJ, partial [Sphingorhabdus sp.]